MLLHVSSRVRARLPSPTTALWDVPVPAPASAKVFHGPGEEGYELLLAPGAGLKPWPGMWSTERHTPPAPTALLSVSEKQDAECCCEIPR